VTDYILPGGTNFSAGIIVNNGDLLVVAVVWRVASNLEFTDAYYLDSRIPSWMRRAMSFAHDGAAPLTVVLLAWWLARAFSRVGLIVLGVIAAAGACALLPQSWARWTLREFPDQLIAQFAPWREHIPPGSSVFWPQSPLDAWLFLDRPSYISVLQSSGIVFSRETAIELQRTERTWCGPLSPWPTRAE